MKVRKMRSKVQVGAEQVALQEVAVILRLCAKGGVVLIFAALADLARNREEIVLSQRNVVEAVGPVPL